MKAHKLGITSTGHFNFGKGSWRCPGCSPSNTLEKQSARVSE